MRVEQTVCEGELYVGGGVEVKNDGVVGRLMGQVRMWRGDLIRLKV